MAGARLRHKQGRNCQTRNTWDFTKLGREQNVIQVLAIFNIEKKD